MPLYTSTDYAKSWYCFQLYLSLPPKLVASRVSFSKGNLIYLFEDEWLLGKNGADPIVRHNFGFEFPPHGVARQTEHVHLDVSAHMSIRQKLAGQDLYGDSAGHDSVDRGVGERVEHAVISTHEGGLAEVSALAVVLEDTQVQLHGKICVQRKRERRGKKKRSEPVV